MKNFKRSIAAAAVVSALGLSAQALAADDENEVEVKSVEKITVTGSRIRRTELEQNTPIFTFDSESFGVRGFTNVADALNASPLFSGSQTPVGDQGASSAGQNQVNLFDLGTQRTLTLVNGKRFVSSQSATNGGSQVDLNAIPAALIDRIETVPLTGAATYGADAIAGTVNVILKENYEGFEVTAQYGNNGAGNAKSKQFSILAGANTSDGRGNVTFGLEFTKDDGLLQCDQDFLCNDNWDFDRTQTTFIDRDGDGLRDDVNGDGIVDTNDTQSFVLPYQNVELALFTPYGSITQAGATLLPGLGLGTIGGEFYNFTEDGQVETCEPGGAQPGYVLGGVGGEGTCTTDFFDNVVQLISPVERLNLYTSFNYEITDEIMFKSDFTYANTKASELANQGGFQTAFFSGTSADIEVPMDNPYLSDQASQALIDAGIPEDGSFSIHRFNNDLLRNGANSNETQVWRLSSQLMGEFTLADMDFYWDVSVVHGQSDILVETTGIVDGRFINAVDAREIDDVLLEQIRLQNPDDATDDLADLDAAMAALVGANGGDTANFQRGDIICGAFADLAAGTLSGYNTPASGYGLVDEDIPFLDGCSPLNILGSQASDESLDFITGGSQLAKSSNSQTVYSANIGGSIFELPAGYFDVVVGIESRIEKGDYLPSVGLRVPITRSSILTPVVGGFSTKEYYAEFVAPVISEDMGIPFVQSFEVSGAYRSQDFTTDAPVGFSDRTTNADVYQASFKWKVDNDLALRGTLSSAFRNPSITELFQPASQTFISGDDPCDSRTVGLGPNPDVRQANCESIGIDTSTFDSNIQNGTIPNGISSGNPELEPETNDSYSYGLIFTPSYVEGLQIAVDYYNLEIEDYIDDVTFETNAATCFDSTNFPNNVACATFIRDDENQVIEVTQGPANVALSTFESVTFRAFYELDLDDMGSLSFDSFTQYNITNEFQATEFSEVEEDVGDYADPEWIGTFDTTWSYGDFLLSHRLRWQGSVKIDSLEQVLYGQPGFEQLDDGANYLDEDGDPTANTWSGSFTNETEARYLHDVTARYSLSDKMSVQLVVNNLLDRKPDGAGVVAEAAGHFGLDEQLGRRYSLRFNAKF
jgi:outer membrane receptor protein involved in Fe transport